jgi:hypothetical protein
MADTENIDYLQPDFDPQTVTMPQLRSILVTHNVQYPGTAKKQKLVDLFTQEVAPQAKKILAQRARAKRSSKGIVDAGSQETDGFNQDLMPPPSTKRSKSPRKPSNRIKTEDAELLSPTKRGVRSSSRQLSNLSESDTGPDDSSRGSHRASRPASNRRIKLEQPEEPELAALRDESVFTDDNPFQSGGSSPPPVKTPSDRRKTTGMETTKGTTGPTKRRQTDKGFRISDEYAAAENPASSFSKTFEIPIGELRKKTAHPPVIEAGEEFTPDEQLELDELQARGETAVVPRNTSVKKRSINFATPIWLLLLTLFGAYAAWYRQEKVAVGYCGLGRPATQILPPNVPVPDWAIPIVEPQCEPCPAHAYCYEDFSVRCEQDFILKPHPLSLGGLVPLPPTCEPDGEKVRRVKAVADKAVEELRERRAQWECGELVNEEGQKEESPAMEEADLREVISKKRSKKMNRQEFDDLWVAAIGEVKAREEVEVVQ